MTEVLFWGDTVTEDMLEFLQLGKAAALLARANITSPQHAGRRVAPQASSP